MTVALASLLSVVLQTQLLAGTTPGFTASSCEDATEAFFEAFAYDLPRAHAEVDTIAVCGPLGGDQYYLTYKLYLEPKTDAAADVAAVDDYVAVHDGLVVRGVTYSFAAVHNVEARVQIAYDYVSAGGARITMRERAAYLDFANLATFYPWLSKAQASVEDPDVESLLGFVGNTYGSGEAAYVREYVLEDVNEVHLEVTRTMHTDDGRAVELWGYYAIDRDCKPSHCS